MRCILIAVFMFSGAGASALEDIRCNAHGAAVTLESGATLYLGKTCDAFLEGAGEGVWWNGPSFIGVRVGGESYMVAEGRGIDCLPFCLAPD